MPCYERQASQNDSTTEEEEQAIEIGEETMEVLIGITGEVKIPNNRNQGPATGGEKTG